MIERPLPARIYRERRSDTRGDAVFPDDLDHAMHAGVGSLEI
jgi:hypothetical protein